MVWARLVGDPVEAEAVAQASEHSHEKHRPGFAHAAEVVEVADIQALVKAAFDAPRGAVEFEPVESAEFFQRQAGEEFYRIGLLAVGEAEEPCCLGSEREVGVFGSDGSAADRPDFVASLVELAAGGQGGARGTILAGTGGFFLLPEGGGLVRKKKGTGGSSTNAWRVLRIVGWLSLTVKR